MEGRRVKGFEGAEQSEVSTSILYEEVEKIVKDLNSGKAGGADRILNEK